MTCWVLRCFTGMRQKFSSVSLGWDKPMEKKWKWWQADRVSLESMGVVLTSCREKPEVQITSSLLPSSVLTEKLKSLLSYLLFLFTVCKFYWILCFFWTSQLKQIPEAVLFLQHFAFYLDIRFVTTRYIFAVCNPDSCNVLHRKLPFRNFSCGRKWLLTAQQNFPMESWWLGVPCTQNFLAGSDFFLLSLVQFVSSLYF